MSYLLLREKTVRSLFVQEAQSATPHTELATGRLDNVFVWTTLWQQANITQDIDVKTSTIFALEILSAAGPLMEPAIPRLVTVLANIHLIPVLLLIVQLLHVPTIVIIMVIILFHFCFKFRHMWLCNWCLRLSCSIQHHFWLSISLQYHIFLFISHFLVACTVSCHHGSCNTQTGDCVCTTGWEDDSLGNTCDSKQCPLDCSSHGTCNNGTCSCDSGWGGTSCNTVYYPCNSSCNSPHGLYLLSIIVSHGKGVIQPLGSAFVTVLITVTAVNTVIFVCKLNNFLVECLTGISGTECSGHGTCNTTSGLCNCLDGWEVSTFLFLYSQPFSLQIVIRTCAN